MEKMENSRKFRGLKEYKEYSKTPNISEDGK